MTEHKQPPKTVAEIGVHIGYINETLSEIKKKIDDSPSRSEHNLLKDRVKTLEEDDRTGGNKYLTRREGVVAGGALTLAMTVVIFVFNLIDKLKGI